MPLSYRLILALLDDSSRPASTPSRSCANPACSRACRRRRLSVEAFKVGRLGIHRYS
jgi:hypothetical protein